MGLSPFAQYHIRQLLHTYGDRLHIVAAPGRELAASEHADLNAVVEGLYLEEAEIERAFQELNACAGIHARAGYWMAEGLGDRDPSSGHDLEAKIFELLGLKLMPMPAVV
jgi:hypothetical protein